MRLARYTRPDGRSVFGTVDGVTVTDVSDRVPTFEALLTDPAMAAPRPGDTRHAVTDIAWEPPIGSHAKIFCVGLNYSTHGAETGRDMPERPMLFLRTPDSLVGSGRPVVRPYDGAELDWEGEVALVIGTPVRGADADGALASVAGVTCMAENSLRDWQRHSTQATAGKNWEASGACGPWLVTRDEIGDGPLELTTRLNDAVVQHDTTAGLAFSGADLIAYVSTFTTLRPGDVIATGTPAGVGMRQTPPRFLRPGDVLEVEVSGVGVLSHSVVDAPALVGAR